MTLGFPTQLNKLELSEAFLEHYLKDLKRVPVQEVETGPIFENVMTADEVDVTKFPTPVWHERDGGRYIGTGSYNITEDPEEHWVNLGTYRVMIQDKKTVGFYISPGKHGRIHRDKYQALNRPMPTAIVLGGDPLSFLMACSETPYGISEYELVGGIRKKPVRVVRGKITGLPIPADAEPWKAVSHWSSSQFNPTRALKHPWFTRSRQSFPTIMVRRSRQLSMAHARKVGWFFTPPLRTCRALSKS